MKKSLVMILFISIFVVGCSSTPTNNSSVKKDKPYTRKITAEEQGYIQLVLNKDYDTLNSKTNNLSNQVQKDYNNIAYILKTYEDAQKMEQENKPDINAYYLSKKYESILEIMKVIKFIPEELGKQMEEMKNNSIKQGDYYSSMVKTQDDEDKKDALNEKVNNRTDNPQSVNISMTKEEVLTEGWGKPNDINRTTTANGTSEQWVYSGYRYLYFEDGILVTIQD